MPLYVIHYTKSQYKLVVEFNSLLDAKPKVTLCLATSKL